VSGVFLLIGGLGLVALALVLFVLPAEQPLRRQAGARNFSQVLTRKLLPHYAGIFMLHLTLTATFIAVPHVLRDLHGMDSSRHWLVYLGVFAASIVLTVPLVVWSERSRPGRAAFAGGVGLAVALAGLVWAQPAFDALLAALVLYFGAFNFLEARLPAALTVAAGEVSRGAALGVFATCQFAGAFAGSLMGGVLLGSHWNVTGIFACAAVVVVTWLPLAAASESQQSGPIEGGRTAGGRLQ